MLSPSYFGITPNEQDEPTIAELYDLSEGRFLRDGGHYSGREYDYTHNGQRQTILIPAGSSLIVTLNERLRRS